MQALLEIKIGNAFYQFNTIFGDSIEPYIKSYRSDDLWLSSFKLIF